MACGDGLPLQLPLPLLLPLLPLLLLWAARRRRGAARAVLAAPTKKPNVFTLPLIRMRGCAMLLGRGIWRLSRGRWTVVPLPI